MSTDPGMGSKMIAMVKPGVVRGDPGFITVLGDRVSPLLSQRVVESFDLAMSLWTMRASESVFHARGKNRRKSG